jgi:hypothetical protein
MARTRKVKKGWPAGAAYLGGAELRTLAGAGLVVETTPGSVATASAAFGWERASASIEIF